MRKAEERARKQPRSLTVAEYEDPRASPARGYKNRKVEEREDGSSKEINSLLHKPSSCIAQPPLSTTPAVVVAVPEPKATVVGSSPPQEETNQNKRKTPTEKTNCESCRVQEANYGLPPTLNTSPLTPKILVWHKELCGVHKHYCNANAEQNCTGVGDLCEILSTEPWNPKRAQTKCLQAIEAELLIHGIYYGFRVVENNEALTKIAPFEVDNYPANEKCAEAILASIEKDLQGGLIVEVAEKPRHITAIYGKEEADKVRPIEDFKQPQGGSINDHAKARKFRMMSHQDAFALMRPKHWMAKLDIKSAFRTVGVHPLDQHLLSFKWTARGHTRYFRDTRFPFGLKCSLEIFCRLSQAVRAMMAARGHGGKVTMVYRVEADALNPNQTVVYVDDFWVIVKPRRQAAPS